MAREFLKVVDRNKEYEFKLTIAIAEFLFSFETDLGTVDGIAYPSIASNWYNANVAFLPKAFHRIYKPVGALWQRIDEIKSDSGFGVGEMVAKDITDQGNIKW